MCAFCNRYFYYFKTFFSVFRSLAVTYVHCFFAGRRSSEDPFRPAVGEPLRRLWTFPHPKRTRNAAVFDFFFLLIYITRLFGRALHSFLSKNAFKGVFGFSGRFGFFVRPFCTEKAANTACFHPKSSNPLFDDAFERPFGRKRKARAFSAVLAKKTICGRRAGMPIQTENTPSHRITACGLPRPPIIPVGLRMLFPGAFRDSPGRPPDSICGRHAMIFPCFC